MRALRVLSYALIMLKLANSGTAEINIPFCGAENPNGNSIDLTEPSKPGPFHDLTVVEMKQLRLFLENSRYIKAAKYGNESINSSYIFIADLYPPPKKTTLNFLDQNGSQPPRYARVLMFRGDKKPPVVEEYSCGPLPNVSKCELLRLPGRRNPVEFSLRPHSDLEDAAIEKYLVAPLQNKLNRILTESYNATLCLERESDCITFVYLPVGTGLLGDINKRRMWLFGSYNVPYYISHPTDFGILCNLDGSDPKKTTLFSTLYQRGDPVPENPQRPPQQIEPDGKRYSLKDRRVKYLDWTFNFRMSALTGPTLYDVRFKGERIAYELGLAEISVFYSGASPLSQVTNYVDSSALLGSHSKSLVPGGDCPEFSTLVNQTFWGQNTGEPSAYDATFCLFEQNNGYPLRRHSSYEKSEGSFYGGMLDSVLTLRSALTINNYDYIIDFIFHLNGVVEARLMSTGYIQTSFFRDKERPYGFQLEKYITGGIHLHIAHFKVDLDVGGTSNCFEILDIVNDRVTLRQNPNVTYYQTKFISNLKTTEIQAIYDFNFTLPKYLIVHNNNSRTNFGEIKAYRVQLNGMAYNILPENFGNEKTISWARHQMVVTKHKDSEQWSSSNYGMFDGLNPVVNFESYYANNETIVDEDLVLWITAGMHHIPHTEDLPVTPTVGNHLSFFLLPYNYFPECPSMGSRDAMYIKHIDPADYSKGVTVNRNGNCRKQCITPMPTLEEDLLVNPDQVLETNRKNFIMK